MKLDAISGSLHVYARPEENRSTHPRRVKALVAAESTLCTHRAIATRTGLHGAEDQVRPAQIPNPAAAKAAPSLDAAPGEGNAFLATAAASDGICSAYGVDGNRSSKGNSSRDAYSNLT